jgi:Icc-related predicted phosphoesterase
MGPFLYVTDLHGNRPKYERTLSLALETGAWLVVNGGDMFPHGRMRDDQAAFLREFLDTHLAKYQAAKIRYFGILANDDLRAHDAEFDAICSQYPLVENLAGRKVPAGPYEFIGFNLVTDFPFRLKDRARRDSTEFAFPEQFGSAILSQPGGWEEIPDWEAYARTLPTIEEGLAALPAPKEPDRAVYVIHGPPAGLGLDVARGGIPVGSPATTRFLKTVQPLLSLHGHIHESPEESGVWMSRVGKTVCLQPGQSARGLSVVVGNLEEKKFDMRVIAVD